MKAIAGLEAFTQMEITNATITRNINYIIVNSNCYIVNINYITV